MQIARAWARGDGRPLVAGAIAVVLCAAVVGHAMATGSAAPAAKPKVVTVADFYFGPAKVTVKKGGSVKWVWASTNTYPHDVHLKQGPKRLTRKGSYSTKTTAVTNARFERSFETPGTYSFICTIHPTQMKLTVTVLKGKAGT